MIKYTDDNHSYVNTELDKQFTSVTTFLKNYEPDRDWDEIARKYAIKHNKKVKKETGVDPKTDGDYWREEWRKASEAAAEKGTAFHNNAELGAGELFPHLKTHHSFLIDGVKLSGKTLSLEEGVYPELLVWSNAYELAGQADVVRIEDNKIYIIDYKTNAKIEKEPYVRWDKTFDTFKHPLSHIPFTTAHKYYLQLNLYAYMIKNHNPFYEIGDMVLRHIHFDEEDNVIGFTDIPVPNMQSDIKRLVNSIEEDIF